VETKPLTTHAEYEACVDLQRATWGSDFRELVAPAMLKIAQKVGGICAGTYEGGRLVGFVYGLTGYMEGHPVHWSHMLAVRDDCRDRGIGRKLKEYQRAELLAAGVTRMLWTFDPLVARNAHLNLNRLGAAILEYVPDMYGENPMSTTDSVIGSDRFVVEWDLTASQPVTRDHAVPDAPVITVAEADDVTTTQWSVPGDPDVLIEIPEDIQKLKVHAPNEAQAWRRLVRAAFLHYSDAGYTVLGLVRDRRSGRAFYHVERR
jgi:predicted GNAT superfamily acetyltransferase